MITGRREQEGVSTVVSAVLVFSLLVIVMSVYMSAIVPDQVADAEAAHMRNVSASLGDIAAETAGSIELNREGDFATQLDLGTTTLPGLSVFHSSGTLSVRDESFLATLRCPSPRLLARDGGPALGGPFGNLMNADVPGFETMAVLAVRVDVFPAAGTATMVVSSGPALVAAINIIVDPVPGTIRLEVLGPTGTVFDQVIATRLGPAPNFVIDGLTPLFGFQSLLRDAAGPFQLVSTGFGANDLRAYLVYWQDGALLTYPDPAGRLLLPDPFFRTLQPLSLVYESKNTKFMQQTYSWQGGAIVLHQESGDYMSLKPFSIRAVGAQRILELTFVDLAGAGEISGVNRATVSVSIGDPTSSILKCTSPWLTYTTSTASAGAWHTAWTEARQQAGLDPVLGVVQTPSSGSPFTVDLPGAWTVLLKEAPVTVRLS